MEVLQKTAAFPGKAHAHEMAKRDSPVGFQSGGEEREEVQSRQTSWKWRDEICIDSKGGYFQEEEHGEARDTGVGG